jgi:hypothetical protein
MPPVFFGNIFFKLVLGFMWNDRYANGNFSPPISV